MSRSLASQLLGRSKYHEVGGSARHAAFGPLESASQCSVGSASQGFSQRSSQDDGNGPRLNGLGGAKAQFLCPSTSKFGVGGSASISKFGAGGSEATSHRPSVDHAVMKRVVDQEARLTEQAALIARLEAKLDKAVQSNTQLQATVAQLPATMRCARQDYC